MATIFRFVNLLRCVQLGHLRRAALLCFSAAAAGGGGAAFGLTRVDIYQASVPGPLRCETAPAATFQAAMKTVLVRATGRRMADDDPVFAPLTGNARRYVQQCRRALDNGLALTFDGAAIERWLTQNGQPLWGRDRPSTFVWLSAQNGSQAAPALSAEDTSDLKQAVDAAALQRGIPLVWPDAAAITSGTASAAAADLAHRLGAEGVLVGRATSTAAGAGVHWTLQFDDRSAEFSGAVDGINRTADLYAEIFSASGSVAPLEIDVGGISDLKDYAGVQAYLEALTFVTQVGVAASSGDTMRFRLTMRGGVEPLQHAIALSGRLSSLPAGDDGIQRFQLRR